MAKLNASWPTISVEPNFAVTINKSHCESAVETLAASVHDAPEVNRWYATRPSPNGDSIASVDAIGVEFILITGV